MDDSQGNTATITEDQAVAIVNEAKAGGFYSESPASGEAMVEAARELIDAAYAALQAKNRYPEVEAIIAIYENGPISYDTAPWPTVTDEPIEAEQVIEEPAEVAIPEPVIEEEPVVASESPALVVEKPKQRAKKATEPKPIVDLVDELIAREQLPVPPDFDDPTVELPRDFTILSDIEIRRYHSTFHALQARASWVLACEENDLAIAQNIHDMTLARAIRENGEDKVTVAKAEANGTPEVTEWRNKVISHTAVVKKLKALAAYYESTCKSLSREWTMRSGERDTAGSLSQRFS